MRECRSFYDTCPNALLDESGLSEVASRIIPQDGQGSKCRRYEKQTAGSVY